MRLIRPSKPVSALAALLLTAALFIGLPAAAQARSTAAAQRPWTLGGQPCQLIEVPTAAPVGLLETCSGVRPGALLRTDAGLCTFNFVFTDGVNRYIGTAGHCVLGTSPFAGNDVGEQVWSVGTGPVARDAAGNRIGVFVYGVLEDPKDFALIRLDDDVPVSPQMCHFGGPTGLEDGVVTGQPVLFHHYGNGVGVGTLMPGRTALAYGMPSKDHLFAVGLALPGDSGSGIIAARDGKAVGVIVAVGISSDHIGLDALDAGLMAVTRLAPQMARASQILGVNLQLVTAPLL